MLSRISFEEIAWRIVMAPIRMLALRMPMCTNMIGISRSSGLNVSTYKSAKAINHEFLKILVRFYSMLLFRCCYCDFGRRMRGP